MMRYVPPLRPANSLPFGNGPLSPANWIPLCIKCSKPVRSWDVFRNTVYDCCDFIVHCHTDARFSIANEELVMAGDNIGASRLVQKMLNEAWANVKAPKVHPFMNEQKKIQRLRRVVDFN